METKFFSLNSDSKSGLTQATCLFSVPRYIYYMCRLEDFRRLLSNTSKSEFITFVSTRDKVNIDDTRVFYTGLTEVLLTEMSLIIQAANGSSSWRFLKILNTYSGDEKEAHILI